MILSRPAASAALVLTLAAAAPAMAAASRVEVSDAWSRPAAAGLPTGVAYLTVVNRGDGPDRLMSAFSPKAGRVSLHRSVMQAGIMRMDPVPDGLELPPGRPVSLKPGGYHLMLDRLKGGLRAGERYPLTLRFAHARPQTVEVVVRSGAAAMAMP